MRSMELKSTPSQPDGAASLNSLKAVCDLGLALHHPREVRGMFFQRMVP